MNRRRKKMYYNILKSTLFFSRHIAHVSGNISGKKKKKKKKKKKDDIFETNFTSKNLNFKFWKLKKGKN